MILEQSYGPVTRLLVQKVGKCQPIMKANVFNAVIGALPYAVKTEFIPFVTSDGKQDPGTYNDLLHNLSNGSAYGYIAIAIDLLLKEVYSQSVQPEQTTSGEDKTLK
ncbi:hypothetical protein Tco_0560667 [Tanacetum coccineum]